MKHTVKYLLLFILFSIAGISYSQEKIYTSVEVMPQFPGGNNEMMKYLMSIKYPKTLVDDTSNSRIVARFVVTKKGKIKNIEILRSLNKDFDKEFVKFIQAMPDWIPAINDGMKVDCYYTIPMTICLQK